MFESLARQVQSVFQSLYLKYKMAKAIILFYVAAEVISTLALLSLVFAFDVSFSTTLMYFLILTSLNTLFSMLAFSYFLYNTFRYEMRK